MRIASHPRAIELAQTELADGCNADATTSATDIVAAQHAEIAVMNGLLQQS